MNIIKTKQIVPLTIFSWDFKEYQDLLKVTNEDIKSEWLTYDEEDWNYEGKEKYKDFIIKEVLITLHHFCEEFFTQYDFTNPVKSVEFQVYKTHEEKYIFSGVELERNKLSKLIEELEEIMDEYSQKTKHFFSLQKGDKAKWNYWKENIINNKTKGTLNFIFQYIKYIFNDNTLELFMTRFMEGFDPNEKQKHLNAGITDKIPVDRISDFLAEEFIVKSLHFDEVLYKFQFGWSNEVINQLKEKSELFGVDTWQELFAKEYKNLFFETMYPNNEIDLWEFKNILEEIVLEEIDWLI